MKKLFNHVLHTLLCLCMFVSGATFESVAQSNHNKNDLISVTLKVKSENGPYSNAKIWDATSLPIIDTYYRTDWNGEVTLEVHPQATLIVGEYFLWDEATKKSLGINEKDFYTKVEIKGRNIIDVVVKQSLEEHVNITVDNFCELKSVQDPKRLLNVKLHCAEIDPSQHSDWWPKPEVGCISIEDNLDLKFPVGKTSLNSDEPHNAKEFAKIEKMIQNIIGARGSTFTNLYVTGSSSPEGNYEANLKLTQGRLSAVYHTLINMIPTQKRPDQLKKETYPHVATWQNIANIMKLDGLVNEAAEIEKIIAENSTNNTVADINKQGLLIRRLGCYNLIKEKYLPKLRCIDFRLDFYVKRAVNINEIRDMYAKGEPLDEYSYYQLYSNETDVALRHKYCKEALDKFPNSIIFQTDHAAHLIAQNRPDTTLLAQYNNVTRFKIEGVGSFKVPEETRINQVVAYIMMNDLEMANKIVDTYLSNSKRPELAPLFIKE